MVKEKTHPVFREKDPARLPWKNLEIGMQGVFNRSTDLERHLAAGAKTVILSAPGKSPEIATMVE
ncbi:MAG: hypothetical protein P0120_12815 [Nitrospira sp.]|nr:hypothetical protein [Nitrospira sp.]